MSCDCSSATPGPLLTLPPRTNGRFRITLFDCVTEERLDLSATPFEWVVQPAADNATVLLTKTLGAGLAPANLGLGEVDILIVPADSDKIPLYQTVTWFFRVTLPEGIYIPRGGSGSICLALNPASTCATVTLPADAPCATVAVVPLNPPSPIYATIVYVDDEIAIEAAARIAGDQTTVATAAADATAKANAAQTAAIAASIPLAQKGAPSGVATLDAGGKLPTGQLPDLAVSKYLGSVASQVAMLALVGQEGDWCTRSDLGTNFIITGADPTQLASWTQLNYPTAPVTSVAGKTGAVTLVVADVAGAAPLASPALTGTPTAPTPAAADRSTKLATTAFVGPEISTYVDPIVSARAARQALVFDGSGYVVNQWPALGAGDWSITWNWQHDGSSYGVGLISFGPDQGILIDSATGIQWRYNNTFSATSWTVPTVNGDFVLTKSGNTLTLYRNGSLVAANTLTSASVSAGSYFGAYNATVPAILVKGTLRFGTTLPYNYALSAAQVSALFRDGAPATVDRGGSMTALNASAWTNSGYSTFTGASATGFSAAVVASDSFAYSNPRFAARVGQCFLIGFTLVVNSGAVNAVGLSVEGVSINSAGFAPPGSGTYTFIDTCNAAASNVGVFFRAGTGDFTVSNFFIIPLGTLAQYGPWDGTGGYWPDSNGTTPPSHLVLVAGVQPLLKAVRSEEVKSVFAHGHPILSVTVQAGRVVAADETLASLDIPGACHGLWMLANEYGSILYIGGVYTDGTVPNGLQLVAIGNTGGATGVADKFVGKLSVANPGGGAYTRLLIESPSAGTITGTFTLHAFHLAGGLNPNFIGIK